MVDLTQVLGAVVTLIVGVVTAFLIPWLKMQLGEARYERVMKFVSMAVRAAEMLYADGARGAEKKAYVESFVRARGFTVDAAQLDAMIESEVLKLQ